MVYKVKQILIIGINVIIYVSMGKSGLLLNNIMQAKQEIEIEFYAKESESK